jgi:hypothetical protein
MLGGKERQYSGCKPKSFAEEHPESTLRRDRIDFDNEPKYAKLVLQELNGGEPIRFTVIQKYRDWDRVNDSEQLKRFAIFLNHVKMFYDEGLPQTVTITISPFHKSGWPSQRPPGLKIFRSLAEDENVSFRFIDGNCDIPPFDGHHAPLSFARATLLTRRYVGYRTYDMHARVNFEIKNLNTQATLNALAIDTARG